MISASSAMLSGKNGPHPSPSHGILKNGVSHHNMVPHGVTGVMGHDSRLRLDAQKFLVPSLPLSSSSTRLHDPMNGTGMKRRDSRSLLNGTIHQEQQRQTRRYDGHHSPRQQRETVSPYSEMLHSAHHSLVHQHQMNPATYQLSRPTISIPSLSPVPSSTSAPSPKTHSPSKGGRGTVSPGNDLNFNSRLYPPGPGPSNGFPHHPMTSHQAAFFAAAAAAAGAPSYPLFGGGPYAPHSTASSYLDTFHNNILAQQQFKSGSSSGGGGTVVSSAYLPQYLRLPYQHGVTSTTSLHSDLIDSSSERYSGHMHQHRNGDFGMGGLVSISKGGPLGMGPLQPPLHLNKTVPNESKSNGKELSSRIHSHWNDREQSPYGQGHLSPNAPSPPNPYELIRAENERERGVNYANTTMNRDRDGGTYRDLQRTGKGEREGSYRDPQRSRKELEETIPLKMSKVKTSNIFTFPPEVPLAHRNGHMTSTGQDKEGMDFGNQVKNSGHIQNRFQPPASPLKRKPAPLQWSFTGDHLSPTKIPKSPSYLKSSGLGFLPLPQSPSYYKVPKSPSVTFKNGPKVPPSPKKVLQTHNENQQNSRSLLLAPMPVEEMPLLEAFRQGSLIQLASGDVKSVENLCGEDFTHSAAQMVNSVKIIYCKVLAIQEILPPRGSTSITPYCKVTLGMESHKQQVILDATLEQPFFVLGRGWSSLSPEMSKQILQLQCSILQVGDICMTLAKTQVKTQEPGSKARNVSVSKTNHNAKPAFNSTVTSPPGTLTEPRLNGVTHEETSVPLTSIEMTDNKVKDNGQVTSTSPVTVFVPVSTTKRRSINPVSEETGPSSPKERRLSNPIEANITETKTDDTQVIKSPVKDMEMDLPINLE